MEIEYSWPPFESRMQTFYMFRENIYSSNMDAYDKFSNKWINEWILEDKEGNAG